MFRFSVPGAPPALDVIVMTHELLSSSACTLYSADAPPPAGVGTGFGVVCVGGAATPAHAALPFAVNVVDALFAAA